MKNGVQIPRIGMGTWQIQDRETMKNLLSRAFEIGYRLIDTAAAYSNEMAVGRAVAEAGIPRDKLFLSDKAWNTYRGYDRVKEACKRSMKKLKTDHLDLYLIHWPASPRLHEDWADINADTWRGMEALYKEGVVRAIGVCNFKARHLEELKKTASTMPMVNQIECHPGMLQKDIVEYCRKEQILIEVSSPLGNGQILGNETLKSIAGEKGRSAAQVCLRWTLQKGMVAIPKTSDTKRLLENYSMFDFELSDKEMEQIDGIPYCGGIGIDSDEVIEFG
ncbi:hypothetical protein C817_02091 [Dorea sp. 5-2]|nr:hypothetical protein C817_02091 [Dorea sp. 5-2]